MGINNVLLICYLYLNKSSTSQIVKMCGIQSESITFWIFNLRELLADSLNFSDVKIGGDQVVVENDETKLGKRKYNRGGVVDGVWVVGGIERTPEKKCLLVEVPDRSAETIEKIIPLYVLPGSIVYTDCFKSYIPACKNLNLPHFTVNHSKEFANSDAGVCTNTIEELNNGTKHLIRPRNRSKKNINGWLWYFIWRRENKKTYGRFSCSFKRN